MLCKKCGANIADTSKFCGYCGESTRVINIQNISNEIPKEVNLGQTVRIEPVELESQNIINKPVVDYSTNQHTINNQVIQNQSLGSTSAPNNNSSNNKKSNKLVWIILGIVLAAIAVVLVIFASIKSSNNSLAVLEQAISNLIEKGEKSATVNAKLSMVSTTGESLAFSATLKAEKKNDDLMNMQITVNESILFEEMKVYAQIDKESATLYSESSLIDMMGTTSSPTPTWVYYTLPFKEIIDQEITNESIPNIEFKDIIDENHFVYIDKFNELDHYELIIDQELINNIKNNMDDEDLKNIAESIETLEDSIKIDFYINNLNELVKIELDMTEYLEDTDDLSNCVLSMEFSDLGITNVEIPNDAKNSVTDLETYMTLYAIDSGYEDDYDYNTDFVESENNVYGF